MSIHVFLSSIVDIAIGIAGFAGIIAAIQQRGLAEWPARRRVLLQILFFSSAMAIVFALLPSVLVSADIPPALVWKTGSGALLAWYIGIVPYRIAQNRKSGAARSLPRLLLWAALAASLQIYNLTTSGTAWPYLFGIFGLVVNGFSVFLLLLLGTDSDDRDRPGQCADSNMWLRSCGVPSRSRRRCRSSVDTLCSMGLRRVGSARPVLPRPSDCRSATPHPPAGRAGESACPARSPARGATAPARFA